MKVLQVSPEAPGYKSGGQRGVLQSILSLVGCAGQIETVDYVGPEIQCEEARAFYNSIFELSPANSIIEQLLIVLHGETNKRYYSWKRVGIDFKKYDLLFLDFTKLDYVIKDVKKANPNIKIITRVHNVEYDYAANEFTKRKGIKEWLIKRFSKRQELNIGRYSDMLLFLSEEDKTRYVELYRNSVDKGMIVPVCVDGPKMDQVSANTIKSILLTGSLWFGANVEGIIWFIEQVLPNVNGDYTVTVAGSHPAEDLKNICGKNGVTLVDSPESMDYLFKQCDILAIPIFDGAGMKVKFAEGLSYGKVIVSTSFGAVGYEVESTVNCFIADNADSFAECISKCIAMTESEIDVLKRNARVLYEDKYSIESSILRYRGLI